VSPAPRAPVELDVKPAVTVEDAPAARVSRLILTEPTFVAAEIVTLLAGLALVESELVFAVKVVLV
jgi:hypothetical protein